MNETPVKAKARITSLGSKWEHWEVEVELPDKERFLLDSFWDAGKYISRLKIKNGILLVVGVKRNRTGKRFRNPC